MPIYEYQCKNCGERTEIIQKVSDPPATTCPACKQAALQRLISAAGFQLKGTGWYVTDFRDQGKPKAAQETAAKPAEKNQSAEKLKKKETKKGKEKS